MIAARSSTRTRTRTTSRIWGVIALLVIGLSLPADRLHAEEMAPAAARMMADVAYLADDAQGGRAPGSAGIERSADYIADTFREAGLTTAPGADGYFQTFEITGSPRLGRGNDLIVHTPDDTTIEGDLRGDFMPLSIGGGGALNDVPIVFAGYGITTDDDAEISYDDYADIDVEGKAVLILRHAPGYYEEDGLFSGQGGHPPEYATFRHKATNAFRHGARAVLMVNDLAGLQGETDEDELLLFTSAGTERYTTIPYVMLKRAFADQILKAAGVPALEALEARINEGDQPKPASQAIDGVTLDAEFKIEHPTITARNVVGVLEGSGPLADETIVVGAHYDHLGRGGIGSLAPFSREIHNGADDNASGTAMILELARRLASRPDPLPRRVVFIAFSAEERGLLGSRHYVEDDPLYPLDQTVAMFNFDMVGRLNDENELTVFGVDSTPGLRDLVAALSPSYGFKVRANARIAGNSDHASFHDKQIPVLFFFTGTHRDYHRPSDDIERINVTGMARIADFAEVLLLNFVKRPTRPEFVESSTPEPQTSVSGLSVSLGTIPDYDESVQGVRLNGVREGGPAEEAGLKAGDIIVQYGDQAVGTIYDLMDGMSRSRPGDKVKIKVKRGEETVTLEAVLDPAGSVSGHGEHGDQ